MLVRRGRRRSLPRSWSRPGCRLRRARGRPPRGARDGRGARRRHAVDDRRPGRPGARHVGRGRHAAADQPPRPGSISPSARCCAPAERRYAPGGEERASMRNLATRRRMTLAEHRERLYGCTPRCSSYTAVSCPQVGVRASTGRAHSSTRCPQCRQQNGPQAQALWRSGKGVSAMRCPYCRHPDSRVVDSREQDEGQVIRRRRSCPECGRRFTTVEEATLAVIKRSGVTEPFSRQKVVTGVRRACQGRPVDEDALAQLAQTVEEAIRATGRPRCPATRSAWRSSQPLRRAGRGRVPAFRQRLPGASARSTTSRRRSPNCATSTAPDHAQRHRRVDLRTEHPPTRRHHAVPPARLLIPTVDADQPTRPPEEGPTHDDRSRTKSSRPANGEPERRHPDGARRRPARRCTRRTGWSSSASTPRPACTPTTR